MTHESMLAELLLTMLAWGIFSTAQVQNIANCALQDIAKTGAQRNSFPDLEQLAKAGNYGRMTQNLHRDIMTAANHRCTLAPSRFFIPFKQFGEQEQLMTLPHEQFAHLYHTYPDSFQKRILPDSAELRRFWEEMSDHPGMEGLDLEGQAHMCVPFGLHGDEVPVTGVGKVWSRSALTFQYFSSMATAAGMATLDVMFWVWAVFEKFCEPGEGGTVDTFMRIFKWSWEALRSGRWPNKDWRGQRLLFACLACLLYTSPSPRDS